MEVVPYALGRDFNVDKVVNLGNVVLPCTMQKK